ncbi:MAG: hypothetical protein ACI837_001402 [Crocinitomicaceae bacterium]|jgi:hypothetical protein
MMRIVRLKKSRIILASTLLVLFVSLGLFSCKKNAAKVMPSLVGDWRSEPIELMPCSDRYTFNMESSGDAVYYFGSTEIAHTGKAKMRNNALYIGHKKIMTVVTVMDSIGTFPGGPICSPGNSYNYDRVILTEDFTFYHFI